MIIARKEFQGPSPQERENVVEGRLALEDYSSPRGAIVSAIRSLHAGIALTVPHRKTARQEIQPNVGGHEKMRLHSSIVLWHNRRMVDDTKAEKNPAAVALGRLGGLKGGPALAAKLTPAQRQASARKAAQARWSRKKNDN